MTEPAEVAPERVARMRANVLDEVESAERTATHRRRRMRTALVGAAAAAVVAIAGIGVGVGLDRTTSGSDSISAADEDARAEPDAAGSRAQVDAESQVEDAPLATTVVTTGSLSARVDDVEAAVEALHAFAVARDGRIDGETVEQGTSPYADLTVRVPAIAVPALRAELDDLGEVGTVSIERVDEAARVADVQARIDSLEASIARLRSIIAESATTRDLLDAEAQLTRRQSDLEALQAQRRVLRDRTSLATVHVSLYSEDSVRAVEPDGFTGGLTRGWNALVDATNAVVEAAGFLVPWLLPIGLVGAVVVAVRRRRRTDVTR
ncbi:hypothetical protein AFL01nite_21090 [Aeromicrobium flavum]|uniref:DUF4349 domain-containing protein n=1 Tax=Aeromicrobium flavum TaxID=416568 RepID=A0A512HWF6_9ACTN|nr:DUF4349 domain-containing protein [Aeromicrobium flavum]GEO89782.1 hypothetical protein AFL01nite_21090 [Aeromicrobium flavum]